MKIKLRDLTIEQYRKWHAIKGNCGTCACCPFIGVNCSPNVAFPWTMFKEKFSDRFLNQEIEIEDEAILTDREKTYLYYVFVPFRDKIAFIKRFKSTYHDDRDIIRIIFKDTTFCDLVSFKSSSMFLGMELNKEYTLKELGL